MVTFFIGENSFKYLKGKDCYKAMSIDKKLKPKVLKIDDFLNKAHQLKRTDKGDSIIVKETPYCVKNDKQLLLNKKL